ncbi:hypothetical protein [Haladaptatus sp. AB643]|uniref:hypothetical protein n=1 Tax=Haladaptatus sp. AB643 TaxID=2934174 RepID=UPI00209BF86A|nr:hypothetical protein [Haladaptatus sp. AB643]MCO8243596.1 hypothetical protein [Haladaptatus sp. AB643]
MSDDTRHGKSTGHDDGAEDRSPARSTRRGFLGAMGLGSAALWPTSRREGRGWNPNHGGTQPWAPRDHDHSGRNGSTSHLGRASPVGSITVDELTATQRSNTVVVSALPSVSGSGTPDDPYVSPSETGGMREAFERLNEIEGGVVYYPSGYYGTGTTAWEIDLAEYDGLRNNWSIHGDGLESSRIRCGSDDGNGIRIHDSTGTAMFYTEIVGVRFEGDCAGFSFVWGSDDLGDAYNSCWSRFSTSNSNPDGAGACQLNFALNSYHYGVHNAAGGVGVELRRVQFSGIEGSVSSGENAGDTALRVREYSFANHFRYLDVEATYDGIHIADSRAIYNVFQNAYFANVRGTAVIQDIDEDGPRFPASAEQGTYFHNPFVAGAVENIVEHGGGTLYVDGSTRKWPAATQQTFEGERYGGSYRDASYFEFEPRSAAPEHRLGRVALADGRSWDPDSDGHPELVISNGTEWIELTDLSPTTP